MVLSKQVGVIGGGAAGFFAALRIAETNRDFQVSVLEKGNKVLGKVKVSGGGRCNVTHDAPYASHLLPQYPRGKSFLKKVYKQFSATDTVAWFEARGVALKVEEDGRMFPVTDSSQTVIDCLLGEANRLGVRVRVGSGVKQISVKGASGFEVELFSGVRHHYDVLVVAVGGYPKSASYDWLRNMGHTIVEPVPSLFTFNLPKNPWKGLEGISVPKAEVRVQGTSLVYGGPLLVTHWGLSGPAVLRTSAWGARVFAEKGYQTTLQVCWLPEVPEEQLRSQLAMYREEHSQRTVAKYPLFDLPRRLWERMLLWSDIKEDMVWESVPKKGINRLVENVLRAPAVMSGKTTFKEEFVTAGGIALEELDPYTMQSRLVPGLYFAGEVLDIDGVTGGYNFQAAWSTGWVAGTHLGKSKS
ncbi:MAG TPA: aminoacetone oxidase family FAD-binding enzyme [Cytophagales bacterium]|nr:aminoacetone oxidase family FAD-binding enzyme [Cytophagales bacterium]HAA23637.1 aminoacetone oxidase family FAD-binding enzyme [Cytophagales bacterium]HAP65360.1 aminoacetone oxidase family FAD-binding enzyme [Cytophagales bacterium]